MRGLVAGLAVVICACYSASPAVNVPCGPGDSCPSGQLCDTAQTPPTCVKQLIDAGVGPMIDAAPACVTASDCTAGAPVCDDSQHVCRGCVADSECPGVCTEYNGQCVAEADAIFISPMGGDGDGCTRDLPCRTFGYAYSQLTATRRVIRVGDGMYQRTGNSILHVTDNGGKIVFSGEDRDPAGATMTSVASATATPATVDTEDGTDVVLEGITITNTDTDAIRSQGALLVSRMAITNNADRGIQHTPNVPAALTVWDSLIDGNDGDGVYAERGATEVLRSTVHNNRDGGISVDGVASVTIIASIITRNGNGGADYGGIRLQNIANSQTIVVSFDTIAFNRCNGTAAAPGVSTAGVADITNSIVTDNTNDAVPPQQICDTCTASYSLFSGVVPAGTGNIAGPAQFVDPATNNYHLLPTSPARDAANPGAMPGRDIDGDSRPLGAGFDIGADEIMP